MRVLILHTRYSSGAVSGENRVVDDEVGILCRAGHEVHLLDPSADGFSARALAARSLVSAGSARSVHERVRADRIDVVHAHNLYPSLGAGVLQAASKAGAAVVLTLHNYRLLCLAGTFYRDGHVCEDCLGRSTWPGVVHACYRGSRTQSAVLTASIALTRASGTVSSAHRFLAVSNFVRAKYVEAGFPAERIIVKPSSVSGSAQRVRAGRYFLVLSRLSPEKGVAELVDAWKGGLGELRIVGDGPERAAIERLAQGREVSLEPSVMPEEVPTLLADARALIVPSVCYETQSRVVVEAYAAGVPVIASRIGGLPEIVDEGKTGVTVEPGDREGWARAVMMLSDDEISLRYGDAAYARWQADFSPERGLAMLESAYREALEERDRSTRSA